MTPDHLAIIDIEALEKLAKAATPGQWFSVDTRAYFAHTLGGFDLRDCPTPEANADYIAAANPQAILTLISEKRELEGRDALRNITAFEYESRITELEQALKESMEALKLAEKADDHHINCPECDGEGSAEQCGMCFPLADAARLSRWKILGIGTAKVLPFPRALTTPEQS